MADRPEEKNISAENTPEINSQVRKEEDIQSENDAPPLPPPRNPGNTAKKWVRFEGDQGRDGEKTQENSLEIVNETQSVPLPIMKPPKMSKTPHHWNGTTHNNGVQNQDENATEVAQIDVSVEESPRPTVHRSIPMNETNANGHGQHRSGSNMVPSVDTNEFENGKVITQILPENKHCPWVTIAHFNPYKMPKSLISDKLTMPVEDYVVAMEMLSNDFRFRLYTVVYRRLIVAWLLFCLFVLVVLLASGARRLTLFGLTLFWLFLTCFGVLVCLFIKKRINKGLHNCVASVNKLLIRYNLLVGVEDRGKLSCHKIVIVYIYMDAKDCLTRVVQYLAQYGQLNALDTTAANGADGTGLSSTVEPGHSFAFSRTPTAEEKAEQLILKYSQSYVKAMIRRTVRFPSRPSEGVSDDSPLHCRHSYCLCQYLRKHHFLRPPKKWFHHFFLDGDIPADERGYSTGVVAYGYPPVIVG